jgi:hypothetical protein
MTTISQAVCMGGRESGYANASPDPAMTKSNWIAPRLRVSAWKHLLCRDQMSFPIATAVSAMRLEKPHSLSYQLITLTKLPPITLV